MTKEIQCPCDACPKTKCEERHLDFLGMQPSSCERWTKYVEDFRNRDKPVRRGFGTKETEQ